MNGTANPRVYVGVDGSLSGLRALRQAVAEARNHRAELHVVHVRDVLPARSRQVGMFGLALPESDYQPVSRCQLDADADALITDSLQRGLGGPPGDVSVRRVVLVGHPAKALANVAGGSHDLLVVGTDGDSWWHHPLRRSMSTFCIRHARCPVLVVPPDDFVRTVRRRTRFRRSPLPRHPWAEFDAVSEREDQASTHW